MRQSKWAERVNDLLLKRGPSSLKEIADALRTDKSQVKRGLQNLMQEKKAVRKINEHNKVIFSAETNDLEVLRVVDQMSGRIPIVGRETKLYVPVEAYKLLSEEFGQLSNRWDWSDDHPLGKIAEKFRAATSELRRYLDEKLLEKYLASDSEFRSAWEKLVENKTYFSILEEREQNPTSKSDAEILTDAEASLRKLLDHDEGIIVHDPEMDVTIYDDSRDILNRILGSEGDNVIKKFMNYGNSLEYGLGFFEGMSEWSHSIPLTTEEKRTLAELRKAQKFVDSCFDKTEGILVLHSNEYEYFVFKDLEKEIIDGIKRLSDDELNSLVREFLKALESHIPVSELHRPVKVRSIPPSTLPLLNYGAAAATVCGLLRVGQNSWWRREPEKRSPSMLHSAMVVASIKQSPLTPESAMVVASILRTITPVREKLDDRTRGWFDKISKEFLALSGPRMDPYIIRDSFSYRHGY